MSNTMLKPNAILLDDELPGRTMPVDERVLRRPSTSFIYEIKCPVCYRVFHQVTLQRGIFCPCGHRDPSYKTYKRLVKADG